MLRWLRWMIALALLSIPIMATASIGGLLERQGLTTTGEDLTVSGDLTVGDDMTITDDSVFGDDVEINGNITLENGEILDNATDAVVSITANDDAAELLDVQVYSSNTSTADNDYFRTSFWIEDDGSVKTELAAINYICTDVTSNTVDAKVDYYLQKADTLTKVLTLNPTSLTAGADNTSDLGASGTEWKDLYIDGTANIDSLVADTADINGGTVDGATVGANSASTGAFTTITASSTITSTGNVLPAADNGADLGASDKEWKNLYIDGSIYADDVQPDCLVLGLVVKYPTASSVDLTSPTVTFSATNKFRVVLSSDENQTGIYPTGGAINQVLVIESYGTGSNTMRFDDGTSMTLGGNITLTEAQGDVLTLLCTSSDGDEWRRLSNADN